MEFNNLRRKYVAVFTQKTATTWVERPRTSRRPQCSTSRQQDRAGSGKEQMDDDIVFSAGQVAGVLVRSDLEARFIRSTAQDLTARRDGRSR